MEYNGMEGIRWDKNGMKYKGRRWHGIQWDGRNKVG
jgi:hypothetical protein